MFCLCHISEGFIRHVHSIFLSRALGTGHENILSFLCVYFSSKLLSSFEYVIHVKVAVEKVSFNKSEINQ
jgi:hypothetical protein